ncbi:MAG: STAS domain-containing protein [Acidobacteriaceae bacterium]
MRDEPLTIETSPGSRADAIVLRLSGPLTLRTLFSLQEALHAQTAPLTILDLSQVPYINSAGLGAVLMFYVSAEKNGRKLALTGVTERVLSLIRMTRVDTVLSMFPSVEAAEQGAP